MPKGYLLLVLHAHLPYVRHPEYDRFLEERWFFEAVTETYIPLVKFLDRLQAERAPVKLTLSISPPLANMMEDSLLRDRCVRHLDMLLRLADRECERTRDWPDVCFLAWMYKRLFEEARYTFVERCGTRLVQAFREHADAGRLENFMKSSISCSVGRCHHCSPARRWMAQWRSPPTQITARSSLK